jgi:glycerate kinase
MTSSTAGVGDAIRAALDCDIDELVICVGGSASTDGGAGMLTALGARLLDSRGESVEASGSTLSRIADVDVSGLDPRLAQVRITVATDVTSPLLGPTGAAAVFAPQKGATAAQVKLLEAGLNRWSRELARVTGVDVAMNPGAGAAGGTAFAAIAALNAHVASGAELIAGTIGLAPVITGADLVITGEGALDAQSRLGKGTGLVARLAQESSVPCIAVCGRVDLAPEQLREMGIDDASSLTPETGANAPDALQSATETAVRQWHGQHRN